MNTLAARPARPNVRPASGDSLFTAWAKATAAAAFFLLFAGGMVTSTGSGLAVPDWPLSFGGMNPPMVGGIFYEHGHRLIAGTVAVMTFVLLVLSRRPGVPSGARTATSIASAGILLQALLGGLTVLLKLPPAVSISHACLGQAVFLVLLAAAVLSVPGTTFGPGYSRVFKFSVLGLGAAYLQLALGALVKHTGQGLGWHILWASAVVVLASLAGFTAFRSRAAVLKGPASLLAFAVPLQLALGLFAMLVRVDSTLVLGFREAAAWRTAHLSGGALTLAAFLLLALKSRRTAEAP
ncbi:MAG: COX15/CtaA family protein [Elusimicrobiota bacterium]|nr:COX15/CtaA family protein [Elusimicrobiota bacterium]